MAFNDEHYSSLTNPFLFLVMFYKVLHKSKSLFCNILCVELYIYISESFSNTLFPIVRCVSLYLELISDEIGDQTSIIAMVLTITPPELRYLTSL